MEFKDNMKTLRTEKGASFADIASVVGKSEAAVRAWEYGRAKPEADTIIALSKCFECTTDYLLGLSSYKNESEKKSEIETLKKLQKVLKSFSSDTRKSLLHFFTLALTRMPMYKDSHHSGAVFCLTMIMTDFGRLCDGLNNFANTKDTDSLMELMGPYYRARTNDNVRQLVAVLIKETVDSVTDLAEKNNLVAALRTYFSEMNLYEAPVDEWTSLGIEDSLNG